MRLPITAKWLLYAALMPVILTQAAAFADTRIAVVDMTRVMNESREGSKYKKELEQLSSAAKKKIEAQRAALKSKEEKLKSSKAAADSKEMEHYRAEVRNFGRFARDAEEELKRKYLKSNKEVIERASAVIRSYAKIHDIDIVLEKSPNMRGPVVFGSPATDITSEIIVSLNG